MRGQPFHRSFVDHHSQSVDCDLGSVPIQVHGGLGAGNVNEKMEPEPGPVRNRFRIWDSSETR